MKQGTNMSTDLNHPLSKLQGNSVIVSAVNDGIQLLFSDGTKLEAHYWRVISSEKEVVSSFDHQQKYGLPAPVDAVNELQTTLQEKKVTEAHLDHETGDLHFHFSGEVKLQVFAFSGYEVWEINFPDGTGEWSNYAK